MRLIKSYQNADFTCGPAVVRTLLAMSEGIRVSEERLIALTETTEADGMRPEGLLRVIDALGCQSYLQVGFDQESFLRLTRERYMALLISTGPCYGRWVLSVPHTRHAILLDDPWDDIYWTMSWDQLADCWDYTFEDGERCFQTALVSPRVTPIETSVQHRPWPLPFLHEFAAGFRWTKSWYDAFLAKSAAAPRPR